jgi:hypothetical protein
LIQTFLDVYYAYPLPQKSPRLLPGTTSILLDSLDDALENQGIRPLPNIGHLKKMCVRIEIFYFLVLVFI